MSPGRRHGPPPWWPHDQRWPPPGREGWHRNRKRIARRIGCAVALVLVVLGGLGTTLVWLILSATGVAGSAPFARVVSGAGLVAGALALAAMVLALRRLAGPVGSLVDAARRVEAGDYSARVAARGPGEMRSLARAFNAMSSRLEAEESRRKSVLADVAHELRTPLTVIRGHAEGVADGVYPPSAESMGPILAATATMEVLVDDLRTLALAEAGGLRLQREPVDVGVLVNETLDTFRGTAEAAGVRLVADVAQDTPVIDGDAARLGAVLSNLLTNALRHTGRGGTVTVSAATAPGGACGLTVRDDGEGIAPDLLPRVFDRFVRGSASHGSGLGLAIVRDIVEAHGGQVTADSDPGEGTAIHVTLPTHTARA